MATEAQTVLDRHRAEWRTAYYDPEEDGGSGGSKRHGPSEEEEETTTTVTKKMHHIRNDPRFALAWIRKKRAEYSARDPLVSVSRASLLGTGSNKPIVLFLVKSPRGEDAYKARAFAQACWRPLIDWAERHARGYYYAAYLVPRRIPTKDPSSAGLTDQGAAAYGFYVRCLLETLKPKLVVPVGKAATRAVLGHFVARRMTQLPGAWQLYAREHELTMVLADPSRKLKLKIVPVIDPLRTTAGQRTAKQHLAQQLAQQQQRQKKEGEEGGEEEEEVEINLDALPFDADELWKVCFTQVKRSYVECHERSRCKRRLTGEEVCERLMQNRGVDPKPRKASINPDHCFWYSGIDRSNKTREDNEAYEVVRVPLRLSDKAKRAIRLQKRGKLKTVNERRAAKGLAPLEVPRRTWVPKLEKAARRTFTLEGGSRQVEARSGPMDQFVVLEKRREPEEEEQQQQQPRKKKRKKKQKAEEEEEEEEKKQ